MNFSFIINPKSGSNRKKSIIYKILREYSAKKININLTEYAGHAAILARQALEQQTANIIAVGGDGTVNEVAGQLVGSGANLGVVPMGSGNGFARSLNIPLKPREAVRTIFARNTRCIDVGKVNDRFFFAVSGIGFDANIAFRFHESKKRGALPYFMAGFKEFFEYTYPELLVEDANKQFTTKPLIITIANASQFGNGAVIAPQADLQDGLLDVCVVQRMSLLGSVKAASKMFMGKINHIQAYSAFTSNRIEVTSKNNDIKYHVDGEPYISGHKLIFESIPQSLNVITI